MYLQIYKLEWAYVKWDLQPVQIINQVYMLWEFIPQKLLCLGICILYAYFWSLDY